MFRHASNLLPALAPGLLVPALLAVAPVQAQGLGPIGIGLVIAFLVISLGLHEAAHAWVALLCGDPTARDLGRISLNPIVHIDLFMTILMPTALYVISNGAFIFGGAKPVPVAYHRLRKPLRDMMLVAIAGPLTNFLLAILFMLLLKASIYSGIYEGDQLLPKVLSYSMFMNVLLAVFNLIPVPPLDGSRVMRWLLPQSMRASYDVLERFGMLIIIVLMLGVPSFQVFLRSGLGAAINAIDMITGGTWS